MKQIFIKITLAVFIASIGYTQTLTEIIRTALAQNYQIQIVKNEAEITANNNSQGNAGNLPSVDLNGMHSTSYNNTLQKYSDGSSREGENAKNSNMNLSATVTWNIFNGFHAYAKKDQLAYFEELGQLNSKFYVEQTVSDIVTAYYQLVLEKLVYKNYQQSLKISSFRLDLENKRKEIGAGTILDYGNALVDFQTDSMRLLAQYNVIQSIEVELNRTLNNALDNAFLITETGFPALTLPARDILFDQAAQNNKQLKQQRLQELISETELRMQKSRLYPGIDLFAGYQYSKSVSEAGFFNSNQSYGPTAGISISFNLYNGGNTLREIENARIDIKNSKLSKEDIRKNLDAGLLNLYNEYDSIHMRIGLAASNVETMQKVFNTAQQQLKQGAINGYDFRLTQLNLLNSELTLIQLQFTLKAIEINLKRFSGTILETYL